MTPASASLTCYRLAVDLIAEPRKIGETGRAPGSWVTLFVCQKPLFLPQSSHTLLLVVQGGP